MQLCPIFKDLKVIESKALPLGSALFGYFPPLRPNESAKSYAKRIAENCVVVKNLRIQEKKA
jgi:hypothetical protein